MRFLLGLVLLVVLGVGDADGIDIDRLRGAA